MPTLARKTNFLVRAGLALLLCIALAVGFLGYLSPGMLLSWENIASMCGF